MFVFECQRMKSQSKSDVWVAEATPINKCNMNNVLQTFTKSICELTSMFVALHNYFSKLIGNILV